GGEMGRALRLSGRPQNRLGRYSAQNRSRRRDRRRAKCRRCAARFRSAGQKRRRYKKGAKIQGVQVQQMVGAGREVMVGAVTDPSFGKLIAFGLGGVLVEVM